jgi:hypothetical protein
VWHTESPLLPVYSTWFPTLHVTLTLLSKIYRAVEIHVFQDMAQQVGVPSVCEATFWWERREAAIP